MKKPNSTQNIDKRLKAYSETSGSLLRPLQIGKNALKAGSAIAAALPCVMVTTYPSAPSKAATFSRTIGQTLMGPNGNIDIDIDGGGANDFRVKMRAAGQFDLYFYRNGGNAVSFNASFGSFYYQVNKLGTNVSVNAGLEPIGNAKFWLTFASGTSIFNYPWDTGVGVETGYVGVKFNIGATPYIGWIEVTVRGNRDGTAAQRFIQFGQARWTDNTAAPFPTLPVELTKFNAKQTGRNSARITWNTASETDNAGFEIERSEDGVRFRSIGWKDGHGTIAEPKEYYFDDKELREGQTYYYRLKQLDFNGQFEFSNIITLTMQGDNAMVGEFFPNPSSAKSLSININNKGESEWIVSVFDLTGKELRRGEFHIPEGEQAFEYDFSGLPEGSYFVKMENGSDRFYRKVIID